MQCDKLSESDILTIIKNHSSGATKDLLLGIGDDCAALKIANNESVLVSSDILIEHIHFDLGKILPFQLGWKSIAVNLSDIAAMGGVPKSVIISLCLPSTITDNFIDELYSGMQLICSQFNTSIAGGDLSASKNDLVVSVTVIGEVASNQMIKRNGAKQGDRLFVLGTIGGSAAGLDLLKKDSRYNNKTVLKNILPDKNNYKFNTDRFVAKHLLPFPRVLEGRELVKTRLVSSMIDLSDGLAAGVKEICSQSKVGAVLYKEQLPVLDGIEAVANGYNKDMTDYVLYGGEDYELLFTADKDFVPLSDMLDIYEIGKIVNEKDGVVLKDKCNNSHEIIKSGFDHFAAETLKR